MSGPTPEKVMQLITGAWAAGILGAAARHGLFTALEDHPDTAAGLAKRVDISPRGAQALLDGLTGLGLLALRGGEYRNMPEASAFLVTGKPAYLGAMAEVFLEDFGTWQKLPQAVKTGLPTTVSTADVADNPFWHVLALQLRILLISESMGLHDSGGHGCLVHRLRRR